ncbi:hypothetical protein GWL_40020 [Herbaspirillum sp. GW103]|nr:hypothetical protein GWL_40020 [Herbaspirillum sp. GW103]
MLIPQMTSGSADPDSIGGDCCSNAVRHERRMRTTWSCLSRCCDLSLGKAAQCRANVRV